jgi:hypothetical protein
MINDEKFIVKTQVGTLYKRMSTLLQYLLYREGDEFVR